VTAEWLREATGEQDVRSAKAEDLGPHSGLTSELVIVRSVHGADGEPGVERTRVLKGVWDEVARGKQVRFGLGREVELYKAIQPDGALNHAVLRQVAPEISYAGFNTDGTKLVLMENLCNKGSVEIGKFFGKESLHNWARELDDLPDGVDWVQVSRECFRLAAHIHAATWRDDSLIHLDWLRTARWRRGEDREAWEAVQQAYKAGWAACRAREDLKDIWDSHLVACMDSALEKASWDGFQARLQSEPWCFLHGDFHPGNVLRLEDGSIKFVDWEMVALGSGPKDVAQFLISHPSPALRRAEEKGLVDGYIATLREGLAANGVPEVPTSDELWQMYRDGVAWWLSMLVIMLPYTPVPMSRFFHDQVAAFLHDHIPDPANAPVLRA